MGVSVKRGFTPGFHQSNSARGGEKGNGCGPLLRQGMQLYQDFQSPGVCGSGAVASTSAAIQPSGWTDLYLQEQILAIIHVADDCHLQQLTDFL